MPSQFDFDRWVQSLEQAPYLSLDFFGNSLAHYLLIIVLVAAVYLITGLISWFFKFYVKRVIKKTENDLDDLIFRLVHRSIRFVLVLATLYIGVRTLTLPEVVNTFTARAVFVLFTLKITWELQFVLVYLIDRYLEPMAMRHKGFIRAVAPPLLRVSKVILWTLAVLLIINNLGYDITSVVAGLGIGGLAFALAAQETLANAFGSLSMLTDDTLDEGDWIAVSDVEGTVEEVGLRSTKIRTSEDSLVTVPNKVMASNVVRNSSRRHMRLVDMDLLIHPDVSNLELEKVVKEMNAVLKRNKHVETESARVHLNGFEAGLLRIGVFYYVQDSKTFREFLDIRQALLMRLKLALETSSAKLAHPTQNIILEKNEPKRKTKKSK